MAGDPAIRAIIDSSGAAIGAQRASANIEVPLSPSACAERACGDGDSLEARGAMGGGASRVLQ